MSKKVLDQINKVKETSLLLSEFVVSLLKEKKELEFDKSKKMIEGIITGKNDSERKAFTYTTLEDRFRKILQLESQIRMLEVEYEYENNLLDLYMLELSRTKG